MKKVLFVLTAVLLGVLYVTSVSHAGAVGNVNFLLGKKNLKKSDWAPVEEHGAFGVLADLRQAEWPVSIALGLVGSGKTTTYYDSFVGDYLDVDASTLELQFGVKKVFELGKFHPYIGGGLAIVSAEITVTDSFGFSGDGNGTGGGLWVSAGGFWSLGRFNLGFNVTRTMADVNLSYSNGSDLKVEAGGTTGGIILGFNFGN